MILGMQAAESHAAHGPSASNPRDSGEPITIPKQALRTPWLPLLAEARRRSGYAGETNSRQKLRASESMTALLPAIPIPVSFRLVMKLRADSAAPRTTGLWRWRRLEEVDAAP